MKLKWGETGVVVYFISWLFFVPVIFSDPDLELQLVQVLFRHGDRNPLKSYVNDPYKNESYWPQGFAQLTKRGIQQQYNLGKFLRSRYNGFLSSVYSPNEINVESTDVDRSLMSAEANLAGLYPPQESVSLWNSSIQWRLIPIHTTNKLHASCPKLEQIMKESIETPYMVKIMKDNQDIFEHLTNNSGEVVDTFQKFHDVYDALYVERLHNFTLPDWTRKVISSERHLQLEALGFKILSFTLEMQRLRVGPLLKDIIQNMRNKNIGIERRKMFMYSAHDTTVVSLLNTLEVFNDLPPPYASAVIMEMWKNKSSQGYFFKVNYKNDTELGSEPYAFTIPGCNVTLCPLDTFVGLMSSKIPVDWGAECREGYFGLVGLTHGALILVPLLPVLVIASVMIIVFIRRMKNLLKETHGNAP